MEFQGRKRYWCHNDCGKTVGYVAGLIDFRKSLICKVCDKRYSRKTIKKVK